ncbi:MAG: hypothetical protein HQ481_11865 [Alphaproteobacteria bacterium]|nr:hypothetical protein [Alphaproteobacteria bacterium]
MNGQRIKNVTSRNFKAPLFTIAMFLAVFGALAFSPMKSEAQAEAVVGRISIVFNNATLCLGLMGSPSAEVEATTVQCDTAPSWTLWDAAASSSRIAYGPDGSSAQYCLDVDTAHPVHGEKLGLWNCAGSTSANQLFSWPTPVGQSKPNGAINLSSSSSPQKCVAPAVEGAQVFVIACNTATQTWTMLDPVPSPAGSQLFTADGTFTASKTATYRVLAIGGGGGGSNDEGAGGGSGLVGYTTVRLSKDTIVTVTVGAGGAIGSGIAAGVDGASTTFGTHLTATGGKGGLGNNQSGGAGGSGGAGDPDASRTSQTGGSNGSNGTSSGAGGGGGQGSSFSANFSSITTYALTAGAGGTTSTSNAAGGGGGGGIVIDDDKSVGAAANVAATARGGVGYGAGGAGGNGTGAAANRNGSAGEGGMLIVEWD